MVNEPSIEVELKQIKRIEKSWAPPEPCQFCASVATRRAFIGPIPDYFGQEYFLCEAEDCLKDALENAIEEICYIKTHRWQLMREEDWNLREGK